MKTSQFVLTTLAMASLTVAGIASADEITKEGYVTDTRGDVVKSSVSGLCWHTGFWTPAMAIKECDPDLVVPKEEPKEAEAPPAAAPEPVMAEAVNPAPAPAPLAAVPEKPAPAVITLQADMLFDFDKSTLRPEGLKTLDDEVVSKLKEYPNIEKVLVTGHTDRIGTHAYNQKLSQRRADAVKDYLIDQGIDSTRIETAAKGETEPVVSCDDVKGKVSSKNRELVKCLQPNRRVEVEIK
jgi:OOP family OmpA-OmpF porin